MKKITSFFGNQPSLSPAPKTCSCPICARIVLLDDINAHLDSGCQALLVHVAPPTDETDEKEPRCASDCEENEPNATEVADEEDQDNSDGSSDAPPDRTPYYLMNFCLVAEVAVADNPAVFSTADRLVMEMFLACSERSQRLFVRLHSRKPEWFRQTKLGYADELGDLVPLVDELVNANLLERGEYRAEQVDDFTPNREVAPLSYDEALALLSVVEIKEIAGRCGLGRGRLASSSSSSSPNRSALLDNMLRDAQQQRTVTGGSRETLLRTRIGRAVGSCIRVEKHTQRLYARARQMFFLNESYDDRDISTFYLNFKNKVVYPTYTIDRRTPVFATREDFVQWDDTLRLEADIVAMMEKGHFVAAFACVRECIAEWRVAVASLTEDTLQLQAGQQHTAVPYLRRFSRGCVLTRVLCLGVESLEREREYTEAASILRELLHQSVYCTSSRGRWYDRLALDLEHLKDLEESYRVCLRGLSDAQVRTGHRYALLERAWRLHKRLNKAKSSVLPPPSETIPELSMIPQRRVRVLRVPSLSDTPGGSVMVRCLPGGSQGDDATAYPVEEYALHEYARDGYAGVHAEGSITSTLFALLFWDVIFTPVPDVFRNQYQIAPLDFATDHFYASRQALVDARVAELRACSDEQVGILVQTSYETHDGQACSGMQWDRFTVEQLMEIVVCFGASAVASLCDEMARDYRHCRGGVPDLTLWRMADRTALFVEVKSLNDRLSKKQIVWLHKLKSFGIQVETFHLEYNEG